MNSPILLSLASLLLGSACACAELNPPQIGLVRYADGTVASVSGLTGNYIVRPSSLPPADALSSSQGGVLLSKDGQISLLNADFAVVATYQSNEKDPVLNIDDRADTAVAWLPGKQSLAYWNGRSWMTSSAITQIGSAQITSVWRRDATTAGLLAETAEGAVWEATVVLDSGELTGLTHLGGVHAPAFHSAPWLIYQDKNTLRVQSSDALQKTFPLGSDEQIKLSFERLSSADIHIFSQPASQDWVLHLDKTETQLSELPGLPHAVPASETKK